MTVSSRVCWWLSVALLFGASIEASAQTAQAPPAQQQAQPKPQAPATQPPQTTPAAQAQPEQAPPPGRSQSRRKKKPQRTSSRQDAFSPEGPFEEARPSRVAGPTREELTVSANVLGGYDDDVTGGLGSGSGTVPTANVSGYTGYADARLTYDRGNNLRSMKADAAGTLQAYPGNIEHPAGGGNATVDGRTRVGRSLTLRGSERVGYEPLFSVFSSGASSTPLPPGAGEAAPVSSLYERRSVSSNSAVGLDQRWGRLDWTSLTYSYNVQRFINDDYGDTWTHEARVEQRRALTRATRLRGEYRYVNRDYTSSDGLPLPTVEHRVEAGPEIDTALSRRRHMRLSLAAGAANVQSIESRSRQPYDAWVPTGTASTTIDVSENWRLEGGYRRDFQQLRGVTDEVYTTDTAYLSTGGLVGSRIDLSVGGTYSNWKTSLVPGVDETLNVYGASLQVRVLLTEKLAATAQYYYYQHRYSNPGALPAGFPPQYDRNAVRVGFSVWVPLKGQSPASSSPRPATSK